eukprot:2184570-Rhodomonas_salina.1
MSSTAGHGTDTGGAMSPVICVRALLCTQALGGRFLRPYPDPRRPSRRSTYGWQPLFGWGPQFQVYYCGPQCDTTRIRQEDTKNSTQIDRRIARVWL